MNKYYQRFLSPEDRFMGYVSPEPLTGCWLWTGGVVSGGYGKFFSDNHTTLAHRWAYEHFKGIIPNTLQLDHKCRVRCCVNPDHLEPVTARENLLRGIGPSANNSRKTNCIHGHPLKGYNVQHFKNHPNKRGCRLCRLETVRRWRERQQ